MTASICKFCGSRIYWYQLNGKNLPFNDSSFSEAHKCRIKQISIEKRVAKNSEDIRIIFHLVESVLDRVSALEVECGPKN